MIEHILKEKDMIVTRHRKEVSPRENPHKVDARDLYRDDNALIVHLLIKAGEKLLAHKTPVDVAFYVLEGRGTVYIAYILLMKKKKLSRAQ